MVERTLEHCLGIGWWGRGGVAGKMGGESELAGLALRGTAAFVSSSMTSFTQCSGTSFTLPHERSPRGSAIEMTWRSVDVQEQAGAFCGGGGARKKISGRCAGVRYLAAHGIFMAAALPGTGAGGHRRAQPASASESGANRRPAGTASGGTAAALSGLGSA